MTKKPFDLDNLSEIKKNYKGKFIPVWWETGIQFDGENVAEVLDVIEYTGHYDFIAGIWKLTPRWDSNNDCTEMSIEKSCLVVKHFYNKKGQKFWPRDLYSFKGYQ